MIEYCTTRPILWNQGHKLFETVMKHASSDTKQRGATIYSEPECPNHSESQTTDLVCLSEDKI